MSGSEGLETEVTSRGLSSRLPSLLLSACREKHHKTIRPKGPAPLAQWPRGLFSLSGSFLVLSLVKRCCCCCCWPFYRTESPVRYILFFLEPELTWTRPEGHPP